MIRVPSEIQCDVRVVCTGGDGIKKAFKILSKRVLELNERQQSHRKEERAKLHVK